MNARKEIKYCIEQGMNEREAIKHFFQFYPKFGSYRFVFENRARKTIESMGVYFPK